MTNTLPTSKIAICILAAGASTRMGLPKQLLKWGKHSLLHHAIDQAQLVGEDVFVVLGAHYDAIAPTITAVSTIKNRDWEKGMGSSIAAGIKYIRKAGTYTHILVMLADQPYLDAPHLKKMIETRQKIPKGIVATQYETKAGVPAIFSSPFFDELEQLDKDYGARKMLQQHQNHLLAIKPLGSTVDIDTQEIYVRHRPKNIKG